MSKPPPQTVSETIELIEALRDRVKDFALREGKLNHAYRLKTYEAEQDLTAEEEARLAKIAQQKEALVAWFEEGSEHDKMRHAKRAERIVEGRRESKQRAMRAIEEDKGYQISGAQRNLMRAQKVRDSDLAAVEQTVAAENDAFKTLKNRSVQLSKKAAKSLGGMGSFRRALFSARKEAESNPAKAPLSGTDAAGWLASIERSLDQAKESLNRYRNVGGTGFFRAIPVSMLILIMCMLVMTAAFFLRPEGDMDFGFLSIVGGAMVIPVVGILLAYVGTRKKAKPYAAEVASHLAEVTRHLPAVEVSLEKSREARRAEIAKTYAEEEAKLTTESEAARMSASEARVARPAQIDAQAERAEATNDRLLEQRLVQRKEALDTEIAALEQEEAGLRAGLSVSAEEKTATLAEELERSWEKMGSDWKEQVLPVFDQIEGCADEAEASFPVWSKENWTGWSPPEDFGLSVPFAKLRVDLPEFADARTKHELIALPDEKEKFTIPLSLKFPEEGCLLFETDTTAQQTTAISSINNILMRILANAPAGNLSFTVIDPLGLGQNFSGIMHLADYKDSLINGRIWTQTDQIEKRLGELGEHIEKVIQMYLRNDYATITEYNEAAGVIAEKFHFLVIADFPANMSDTAANRLLSIISSGAKCGVYTMIQWNRRDPLPVGFATDVLREMSIRVHPASGGEMVVEELSEPGVALHLDAAPETDFAVEFVHRVGEASKDAGRVEVPFSAVTPDISEMWTLDSTKELRVPIGRTGATKLQYLAIGDGTKQHALFAGKTGSGKSTLFHVIITNLALWHSPDEVEFYLIDFKKGVEFKCYANQKLPHARVVAIESDRDFGLSVLQRVDEELKRRGDLFRDLGVQDLAGYERATGGKPMPRTLLLIDEFQELFVEEDRVAQSAGLLLDRIVRQGRAFGVHVLLGSQTLGGAFTLARTTFGQMVIRVALQCNEADAYLIMDDTNPAPRLLSRPGEGIYNDAAGAVEANSPFQVVWLSDEERDLALDAIAKRAERSDRSFDTPIVFEGNAPADVDENNVLRRMLETETGGELDGSTRLWLGAPNSIKDPTNAHLQRQSGNHVLMVGQRDESILAMMTVGIISAAAHYGSAYDARYIVMDASAPGTPEHGYLERLQSTLPQKLEIARGAAIEPLIAELGAELRKRADDESLAASAPPWFVFINGLQRQKRLKYEEDFSFSMDDDDGPNDPGTELNNLIIEGASLGIHLIVSIDSYSNVSRFLSRKALAEFEMRVLFQMSVNDSGALIDSGEASTLGFNRALLYNEQEGYSEVFRPYALPSESWIRKTGELLANK